MKDMKSMKLMNSKKWLTQFFSPTLDESEQPKK